MSKIRILPDQLANQIAAGEVVERPASVVKELLENSLDAGATRVEIEIEGGGTGLIRVIDNGEGMDEDDVLLSLERHGTSKIITDADLGAISTLGFRGEAIPSIGSVSKMTIISRRAGAELGTRAELHFGRLIKVHEAGCSQGTIFEVRNLFGNTPARKKFLRTMRTEISHIEEVVRNYALARPEISLSLSVGGKRTLSVDSTLSLEQRLAGIMNYAGDFLIVGEADAGTAERYVHGFLVPPEKLQVGPARLRLFVNGRAVRDRLIVHGVAEGLRNFLMKGKNPAGLIHLHLPPAEVDVNVHPAKHEVRFRNSRDVHFLISSSVAAAMQKEQRRLQTSLFGKSLQHPATALPQEGRDQPEDSPYYPDEYLPPAADPGSHTGSSPADEFQPEPTTENRRPLTCTAGTARAATLPSGNMADGESAGRLTTSEPLAGPGEPAVQPAAPPSPRPASLFSKRESAHDLQVIGQYANLYIFCSNSEGLLVIDQHAAHERLLFEELRRQFRDRSVARQNLLFPETVELTIFQQQLVERHAEEIEHMGFSLREFGGSSYIISAVPALISRANPAALLTDVLEQFGSEGNRRDSGDRIDSILATMACKAAVKAGTALSPREIDALLDKMARADLFSHCPHGRPVVKHFSQNDIKKWFYRT